MARFGGVPVDEPRAGGRFGGQPVGDDATTEDPSVLGAIPAGVNNLAPSLLGLPMDTAVNAANLGIAAYGTAKGAMGGTDLPDTIPPQIGGSEWFKDKLNQGARAIDPDARDMFANPRPDSKVAQMLHTGSGIATAGLLSPATSAKQAAGNVARMLPSATGAAVAQQVSDNPLAPLVGAMTPLAMKAAIPPVKPTVKPEMITEARQAGYRIPPSQARATPGNNALEGFAGKATTAQKASIKNQQITNELANKSLGLPKGTQITSDLLINMRRTLGDAYKDMASLGKLKTGSTYAKQLSDITKRGTRMAKEFPALTNKDVEKYVNAFKKKSFSADATVEAIKNLRDQSSANFKSLKPADKAMGHAQREIANALEGVLEKNAPANMLPQFRAARQQIAKTYTVEKALNDATGNVSTRALARDLAKGKPLSGELSTAGRFGQAFPKAAQDMTFSSPGINPLDYVTSGAAAVGTGNPSWLAALTGRPLVRSAILSKPYQAMNVNAPKAGTPVGPRAAALAAILAQKSNNQP